MRRSSFEEEAEDEVDGTHCVTTPNLRVLADGSQAPDGGPTEHKLRNALCLARKRPFDPSLPGDTRRSFVPSLSPDDPSGTLTSRKHLLTNVFSSPSLPSSAFSSRSEFFSGLFPEQLCCSVSPPSLSLLPTCPERMDAESVERTTSLPMDASPVPPSTPMLPKHEPFDMELAAVHAAQSHRGTARLPADDVVLPPPQVNVGGADQQIFEHCPPALRQHAPWRLADCQPLDSKAPAFASTSIFPAVHTPSGTQLCLKSYPAPSNTYDDAQAAMIDAQRRLNREISIHSRLLHPNVLTLYGVFEDADRIVLVMEYAEQGSLLDYVQSRPEGEGPAESEVGRHFVRPLLEGLAYLHRSRVYHRGLQVANVLLAGDARAPTVKIADLAFAIDIDEEPPIQCVGALECMSPEVLCCTLSSNGNAPQDEKALHEQKHPLSKAYDERVDTWSLGVLTYRLLCRRDPFARPLPQQRVQAVFCHEPEVPDALSADAKSFLREALLKRSAERQSARQLLRHAWVQFGMHTTAADPPRSKRRLFT